MSTPIKKILLGAFLLLFSNMAFANLYQVEMLVFEYMTADSSGEFWKTGDEPKYEDAIELSLGIDDVSVLDGVNTIATAVDVKDGLVVADGVDSGDEFELLPVSSYKLGGVGRLLKLSSDYRPVYHIAWQQPELEKSVAKKVHIKNLDAKINGTVNLRGGHLLHIDVDMSYFIDLFIESEASLMEEMNQEEAGIEEINNVETANEAVTSEEVIIEDIVMTGTYGQIKETRQIKLNELHYFDHPLFGVIMRVTRLEVEE